MDTMFYIVIGLGVLLFLAYGRPSGGIDVSVNNRIIATDGHGRYLVQAKTSRQILGPRPHTTDNLPAHLIQIKKGLWIVDRNTSALVLTDDEIENIKWIPMNGSIDPRGNGHSRGYLSDMMEGYEHKYIRED